MTTSAAESDMSLGVGLVFTVVAVLGAGALGISGFLNAMESIATGHGDPGLQVISGAALTVSLLAGSVAIVALHLYHD